MLTIPDELWQTVLDRFAEETRPVEQVAYLDGVRVGSRAVAVAITLPDADLQPYNYSVSSDAMAEAGDALRAVDLERLAQVHVHPGSRVRHSEVDDAYAYSHRPDAISIVLANYGRHRPSPTQDGGVHVREDGGWVNLSREAGEAIIELVPSVMDFRRGLNANDSGSDRGRGKRKWWPLWRR